jgi:hypothetical protein
MTNQNGRAALPIVCSLTAGQIGDRRGTLLPGLTARAAGVTETADGYRLDFGASPETLQTIVATVEAERRCCRFLRFTLTMEPDEGPLSLDISGPPGTAAFLDALLHA